MISERSTIEDVGNRLLLLLRASASTQNSACVIRRLGTGFGLAAIDECSVKKMADSLGTVRVPFQDKHDNLAKLTVLELQQELKRRGLKRSGVKAKLIERLKEVNRAIVVYSCVEVLLFGLKV